MQFEAGQASIRSAVIARNYSALRHPAEDVRSGWLKLVRLGQT
jgi:hypothetical protein